MKHTKFFIFALVAAMTFSACGTDDTLQFYYPENGGNTGGGNTGGGNTGGGSTGGNTGGESTDKNNTNKNVATANMPQVVRNAIGSLEFPKLKNNGTSYAIVHIDKTTGMLNYSTEWDDNMKSQRWSCYTFHTGNNKTNVDRPKDDYPSDTDLKSLYGVVDFTYDPYTGNGRYDHGHICPSGDRRLNSTQERQTDFLTNMQPQYAKFNQNGTWIQMENALRKKANAIINDKDTLFVVKGGTIDSPENIIEYINGRQTVYTATTGYIPVPKYFFVAILEKAFDTESNKHKYSAFGYWFPHEDKAFEKSDKLGNYIVNIKTLEDKTGIDFFCNLPDGIEKEVENVDAEIIKNLGF